MQPNLRTISLLLGPLLFIGVSARMPLGLDLQQSRILGLSLWMLLWWFTEVIPLGATALLPLVVLPAAGLATEADLAKAYGDKMIFLFLGGFFLAEMLEKTELHKRLALSILDKTGTSSRAILGGFMLTTFFLSLWISNTATAVMMLPLALSVLQTTQSSSDSASQLLSERLLLGIAFSASIGGIGTLIGTPPNLVYAGFVEKMTGNGPTFAGWFFLAFPTALVLGVAAFLLLSRGLSRNTSLSKDFAKSALDEMGPTSIAQQRALLLFGATVSLWIFRVPLVELTGWTWLSDTIVALIGGLLAFIIPSVPSGPPLLEWYDTRKIPWGILLLFGGGLALATGLENSGLTSLFAQSVSKDWPLWTMILASTIAGVWLTEFLSNMALVTAFMPVLWSLSQAFGIPFEVIGLPLTLGASCAFMLPMATPPNAIVISSGHVTVRTMAKQGFYLNLFSTFWIFLVCYAYALAK